MLKFFNRYRIPLKILVIIGWVFIAVYKIFLDQDPENEKFSLFIGIPAGMMALFNVVDMIAILRERTTMYKESGKQEYVFRIVKLKSKNKMVGQK